MPVEIRELQITTVIQGVNTENQSATPAATVSSDEIIAACVEQVLEILKQKNER